MQQPNHVTIIMDGNGRWAQARGLSRSEGHAAGADCVRECCRAAIKNGVRTEKVLDAYDPESEEYTFLLRFHRLEASKKARLIGYLDSLLD